MTAPRLPPILGLAIILCACLQAGVNAQVNAQVIEGEGRAIDGDSLYVGGREIRLWGIDAPEFPTAAGRAAKAALRRLAGGRWIVCEVKARDRYDRAVALCRTAGADLAAALVASGHARDWPAYSGGYYRRAR